LGLWGWTGEASNSGVTMSKNALGSICFIFGLSLVWHTVTTFAREKCPERKRELVLCAGLQCMVWWLVSGANSATSLMALIAGICTVLLLGMRFINKKLVGIYLVAALLLFTGADFFFDASDMLIVALGRDSSLTTRTDLWDDVLRFRTNPILGAGFETFWLGYRLEWLQAKHWWGPNQAHNGYLEMYINLGWIGIV